MMPGIIFIGPILEARELVCYAVLVVAGRAGHITVPLLAVRIGPPVPSSWTGPLTRDFERFRVVYNN